MIELMIDLCIYFGFMTYQPLWVIQCKIHFYLIKQIYSKQFILALVHSLIAKNISI